MSATKEDCFYYCYEGKTMRKDGPPQKGCEMYWSFEQLFSPAHKHIIALQEVAAPLSEYYFLIQIIK